MGIEGIDVEHTIDEELNAARVAAALRGGALVAGSLLSLFTNAMSESVKNSKGHTVSGHADRIEVISVSYNDKERATITVPSNEALRVGNLVMDEGAEVYVITSIVMGYPGNGENLKVDIKKTRISKQ